MEEIMLILYIIVFLFPAIIATYISEKINRQIITRKRQFCTFCLYSYLILWINIVFQFYRGWNEFAFERLSVQFLLKYMPLSLALAVSLPFAIKAIDWLVGRYITGKYKRKF